MLLNDLYTVTDLNDQQELFEALIHLQPEHRIFGGHFPQSPVLPGVCMMQIVKEMLEMKLRKGVIVVRANHLKFLTIVDPRVTQTLNFRMNLRLGEEIQVQASLFLENTVFFKFSGQFREVINHPV
jgi:3-hydroxyacyl-[acyl-carrier-protein] dehydratase